MSGGVREDYASAGAWLQALEGTEGICWNTLRGVYGPSQEVLRERAHLLRSVLRASQQRFGDLPVRVFRSPGRINLRGMHVDTHGGYLNLMTHQREVVLAVTSSEDDVCTFVNTDPAFDEVSFRLQEMAARPAFRLPWQDFIMAPEVQAEVARKKGSWGNYLKGAALRAQYAFPDSPLRGVCGVVGSDLPRGAALSSSHALCIVTLSALLARNGTTLKTDTLILAVRDAEWYTGARSGTSDQSAEILGERNTLVNVALLAEDFDSSGARRLAFPDELSVLVINSHTQRSLSGADLAAYTRNRFAYSMAMEILRQELRAAGRDDAFVSRMDRLSRMTPGVLGGNRPVYALLERIPEELPLAEMRQRYNLPGFDTAYEQYFGGVPEAERPDRIGLRGPLFFGLAESERARLFLPALERSDYETAGRLMNIGHDGDRRVDANGKSFAIDLSDKALQRLAEAETPIAFCPGAYGASSPVLDALVDAALSGGALGASLTGAGIAGTVLALCRREDDESIADAVRRCMATPTYAALAGREGPLSDAELDGAIVVNHAPAGAGELRL